MDESEFGFFNETVMVVEDLDDTVCSICWAEFLDAEDLRTHVTQVHLSERRRLRYCDLCIKIFPDLEQYMSHMMNIHLRNFKCCKHCFRLFTDIASKMQHEKKHKYRAKDFYCSHCDESFNDRIFLERHEYSAHGNSGSGIMINHGFSLLSAMLHMNFRRFLSGYNEDIIYICACCQFSSNNMLAYIEHLQETSCKTYACDICLNVYHSRKNLIRHFTSSHGKHNIVECPKCHTMYTKSALYIHEKTCCMLNCLDCNIKFTSVTEITNHRMEKHEECAVVKTCRFCQKQVVGDSMMMKHIERTHKSTMHLYKYKCVYCDIIYKHPKQLFGHFFSSHKDLEPYNCMICNEKFRVRKQFTAHIQRVHKNIGSLEYNDKYHVTFITVKSTNAFVPKTLYTNYYQSQAPINVGQESVKEVNIAAPETPAELVPIEVITIDDDSTNVEAGTQPVPPSAKGRKNKRITKAPKFKHKRKQSRRLPNENESSDDSEVPLVYIRKARRKPCSLWNRTKNKKINRLSHKLICIKCNKNCYTLQNYRHHMSFHEKNVFKKCIKCKARFKRERDLRKHIEEKHSNSVLTETLKKVLERRKLEAAGRPEQNGPVSKKRFKIAMNRVIPDATDTLATLTKIPQPNKESAKNFIENFVPEVTTDTVNVRDCVTMGITTEARPPKILVRKCDLRESTFTGLKKPVNVAGSDEKCHVTLKVVEHAARPTYLNYGTRRYNTHDLDHSYCEEVNTYEAEDADQSLDDNQAYPDHDMHYIPEVAEEVMLGSENVKLQKTVVVQNVPKAYNSIRIGTLQPQAPYYKIVKLDDILNQSEKEPEPAQKCVSLPDGTQLVTVNPLAHLIDTEGIKKKMPKKYYQCKPKDIGAAMSKFLDTPKSKTRKRKLQDF